MMKLIKNYNSFILNENIKKIIVTDANISLIIRGEIKKNGPNVNLNHIDVSNITDMSHLFSNSEFNGDISNWDVSNVTNMRYMFKDSKFNGDLSKWDVSNVTSMSCMFNNSLFNGDISNWNVSNVGYMSYMFKDSVFNRDISNWNISNVRDMSNMFLGSKFNQDISNWDISNVTYLISIFHKSKIEEENMPSILDGKYYELSNYKSYDNAVNNSKLVVIKSLKLFLDNDDYYYVEYNGLYFKCDGEDGINEFIKNWNI